LPQMRAHFANVPNANLLIPLTLTIPAACLALLSPIAGWLTDRFGRRSFVMAAMSVYAIVGVAPVWLDGLLSIFLSRIGVGICEAVVLTGTTTLLGDYFKGAERDRWLANQTAIASLSSIAFFAIGGELGTHGWRAPFLVYASSLLMLVAVWRCTWEPQASSSQEQTAAVPAAVPLPWARLLGICAVTVLASIFFYTPVIHLSVALTEQGIDSPRIIGWLTALVSLGVPLGTLMFRSLARHLSPGRLLAIEFLLIGAGFVGMSHAQSHVLFIVLGALNQLGCGMLLPTLLTWAVRGLVFSNRGRGTGLWQSSFSLGQPLSAVAAPAIAVMMGDGITLTFQVFGYVALTACVATALVSLRGANLPHDEHAARIPR
jgi:MFS family permease